MPHIDFQHMLIQYLILLVLNTHILNPQHLTIRNITFRFLQFTSVIHVTAPPKNAVPFTPLPTELIRAIFELAAQNHRPTGHALLLVSRPVRRWIHPIVYSTLEIFTLSRMITFWEVFSGEEEAFSGEKGRDRLLGSSVRNLAVCDDTTGDFTAVKYEKEVVADILRMCKGARRLAINYTRGIKSVEGPKPYELTIRRGLRGVDLNLSPFKNVTHLQCRFEQLMSYVLPKLATERLTHVCFTHHLDFDSDCTEVVEHFLEQPQLELLIIEVTYHKWDQRVDPEIRKTLAEMKRGGSERKLFVRLSKYETVNPYDEERFFERGRDDVWNIEEDTHWRTRAWSVEMISSACGGRWRA